ncbi:crossover junction endodeoxyribonuclease RuvC [Caedimonas varicaedens]|uniref:Crossover junction endodeoxyribonuclease RuvC n=1 Tax=Caedimonas varicaedens TaxID=1629334 RepID=A0A0K8MCF2_9PROT|nr:crossover junction endodeoxyribonuclease RuvC [Caedimonas varicaedens]
MTAILALDLGTTTGWALSSNGEIRSGSVSFKDTPFDSKDSRFTKFSRWLANQKANFEIEEIVYESVMRHVGVRASHVYGAFMGVLQVFADKYEIPYEGVPVSTIKKSATGKGNASKEDMVKAMEAKGHKVKDDNEADALALLYWRIKNE